mmetsp:Transcript_10442/g.16549  ORF Transcript_10442/g.16549 Transcript_10442/m.16549 type:complete len:209 (+) Transcript_10442:3325-3951(+)
MRRPPPSNNMKGSNKCATTLLSCSEQMTTRGIKPNLLRRNAFWKGRKVGNEQNALPRQRIISHVLSQAFCASPPVIRPCSRSCKGWRRRRQNSSGAKCFMRSILSSSSSSRRKNLRERRRNERLSRICAEKITSLTACSVRRTRSRGDSSKKLALSRRSKSSSSGSSSLRKYSRSSNANSPKSKRSARHSSNPSNLRSAKRAMRLESR